MSNNLTVSFSSYNNNEDVNGEEVHQQFLVDSSSINNNSLPSSSNNLSGGSASQLPSAKRRRKRNLPGTPDPTAEVIALSPNSLLSTKRYICEVCNKGFQREQNLQLHLRGHNLPWKLKQRASNNNNNNNDVVRKRVYVCPEPSCVHHNPSRALGDLTGIKKHFSRKHCPKNLNCDKCLKKYAVISDLKAHAKICGTKEYTCECGTIFSRKDSFITHRAFCNALAQEHQRANQELNPQSSSQLPEPELNYSSLIQISNINHSENQNPLPHQLIPIIPPNPFNPMASSSSASLSATALLQKAAQMGATSSNGSMVMNSFPMMNKNQHHHHLVTSIAQPAPSSFGALMLQNDYQSAAEDHQMPLSLQFFFNASGNVEGSRMNDMGMFQRLLDQNNALMIMKKNLENNNNNVNDNSGKNISVLHGGDLTTVDFMGVGGRRNNNLMKNIRIKSSSHRN